MKFVFFIILLSLIQINSQWTEFFKTGIIKKNKYQAYTFNIKATEIQFKLETSNDCDIFVMKDTEFQKFQQKLPFVYIFGGTNIKVLEQNATKNLNPDTLLQAGIDSLLKKNSNF
jgi:hypothetical protein